MAPMMANCTRCCGVQSTLAPRSSTQVHVFLRVGSILAIAGRSMPLMVLSTKRAVAISAGIAGRDTRVGTARFHHIDGDAHGGIFLVFERRLRRLVHGDHFSGRWMRKRGPTVRRLAFSSASMASGIPTSTMFTSGWSSRNRSAAGTVTCVPWSPPMASTATVISISLAYR